MSKLIYALTWFFATCLFLISGCFVLSREFWPQSWPKFAFFSSANQNSTSESDLLTPETLPESTSAALARTADARAQLVANFIERNDRDKSSPLQPYEEWGRKFVAIADEFGLDFRLLPAIARKESTFCKSNVAKTYYNCFGYGVPASGITEAGKFTSYEEGVRTVAASLKKSYLDKGLTNPESIMKKYCPPSDGTWADHLNQWLAEMRYDDKQTGKTETENADLTEFTQ